MNYTIQDAFKRRQVYTTKKEKRKGNMSTIKKKKLNDKLISRTIRNLFFFFQYIAI